MLSRVYRNSFRQQHSAPLKRYSSTMASHAELIAAITAQGAVVRTLKAEKADAADIDREVATLQGLKGQLGGGAPGAADTGKSGKAKKAAKFTLKTPKVRRLWRAAVGGADTVHGLQGTKDWHPTDMLLRQTIFRKITDVFELHGGVTIDTPVFELKEILSGKYGEDSKLIYDLEDQGEIGRAHV